MRQDSATVRIQVLGTGCPECGDLARMAETVAAELCPGVSVEVVGDLYEILSYHVMTTPALLLNDDVVVCGWMPTEAEIRALLRERIQ